MNTEQEVGSRRACSRFLKDVEANSALEYAIMLGLIGVTLLPMAQVVGQKISGIAQGVADVLSPAPELPPCQILVSIPHLKTLPCSSSFWTLGKCNQSRCERSIHCHA